ncbi:MAG: Asp-tRNA(Asn)/Glu-tRNA(Gln) amidotransferase subunit GatC [Alphaproteobacteria bacterium]
MDFETVERITSLARISLKEDEKKAFVRELSKILEFVSHLEEVSTDGVEPLVSVAVERMPMRPDEVTEGNIVEKILENAPQQLQQMFVVPKVIE